MLDRLRARFHRPTPATAIALIALFVALGGTGYAALKLPKNSVGTKQLKANAVTGAKVKNGTLSSDDFGGTVPTGAQGPKGDTGPAGTNGAKGDKGTDGTNGTNGTNGTQGPTGPAGAALVATARCSTGQGCPVSSGHAAATDVPLGSKDTWTQLSGDAGQVDVRIVWQPATTCTGPAPGTGGSQVKIEDGGDVLGQFPVLAAATGPQTIERTIHLFPPNATAHDLKVTVGDNCTGGGPAEQGTVMDVKIDAVVFSAP